MGNFSIDVSDLNESLNLCEKFQSIESKERSFGEKSFPNSLRSFGENLVASLQGDLDESQMGIA